MHPAIKKAGRAILWVILGLFAAAVVLSFLAMGGCSATGKDVDLHSGCDLVCKSCGEIKLNCNQSNSRDVNTENKGTISGPSLGG